MSKYLSNKAAAVALFAFVLACACPARAGGVVASVGLTLDNSAGLNYEEALVTPHVTGAPGGATLKLVVTDPVNGASVRSDLPLTADEQKFPARTPARMSVVDGYVMSGSVTNAAAHDLLLMGRLHDAVDPVTGSWNDNWLYETAATFAAKSGTGTWSGRDCVTITNGLLSIDTNDQQDQFVTCTVESVPTPRRGCVIAADLSFPTQTLDAPDPSGQRLGLTVGYPDDDLDAGARFLYVTNGAWCVAPLSVCDPLVSTNWQVRIAIDHSTQQATYYVRPGQTDAWTILGTASDVGADSITELSFCGEGDVSALEGHGFDTQLVQVDVQFDTDTSLSPGCNFEQTVVTGRVVSTLIHDTDRMEGNYTIRLVDLDGNEVACQDYSFTAEGTMEFRMAATNLVAGTTYKAYVDFAKTDAQAESEGANIMGVMGRALTNADWAVSGKWLCETARTFAGAEPGSGVWTGGEYASTNGEWICVTVDAGGATPSGDLEGLAFEPTNRIDESYSSLVVSCRAVFDDLSSDPGQTNDTFGVTVTYQDGAQVFACLDNHVWQPIPRTVAIPELGKEYEFTFHVRFDTRTVVTVAKMPDGRRITLHTAALDDGLYAKLDWIRASGAGKIADLTGVPYSTDLLRITTAFDDDALDPGLNFEHSTANGSVTFEKLWETDRTNETLRVVVRDRNGNIVDEKSFTYDGIDGEQRFALATTNLVAGETYSAEVVSDVTGVVSDGAEVEDVMARALTNADWAVSNLWIYENARTFAGAERGSGVWSGQDCAHTNGEWICVRTDEDASTSAGISFQPTNALSETYSTLLVSIRAVFTGDDPDIGATNGVCGVSVVSLGEDFVFTCLSNHVWRTVPRSVAQPALNAEYELTFYINRDSSLLSYFAQGTDGRRILLMTVEMEAGLFTELHRVRVFGEGDVTDLTGVPYSTDLLRITTAFDDDALHPGLNFEQTTASGSVTFEKLWETDRTNETLRVVVRDRNGNIVDERNFRYDGIDGAQTFEFSVTNLVAGEAYSAEVVSDVTGVVSDEKTVSDVMARALTNANWAVSNLWIYENARTYDGIDRGSGVWTGREHAYTSGEWISVRADGESESSDPEGIVFQPTNVLDEAYSTLIASIRAVFGEAVSELDQTNQLFGVTVVSDGGFPAFACLSNHVWRIVPRTVIQPAFETEYEFTFYLQKSTAQLSYFAKAPGGRITPLLTVEMADDLIAMIPNMYVAILGNGDVTDLTGVPYSTDLIRITTSFDDDTLYPGLNFEQSTASGSVTFEKLWETDRTNEVLRVVVRDRNGNIVDEQTFRYDGIDGAQTFELFTTNLVAGETYSAEVVSDITGVTSDEKAVSDVMGRALTNADWAVSNLWIYENARTYAGADRGSGVWTGKDCAHTNGEWICVRAGADAPCDASAPKGISFQPTNTLDESYATLVASLRIVFPDVSSGSGEEDGFCGVTVTEDAFGPVFACLSNHVWRTVPRSVATPELGVEYELTFYLRQEASALSYFVRLPSGRQVALMSVDMDANLFTKLHQVDVIGNGDVTDLTGVPYSTDLIRITTEYEGDPLYPGLNFEQSSVNGTLTFEKLWETDRTNEVLRLLVRDRDGNIVDERAFAWTGEGRKSFEFFIQNLDPGQGYSFEVVSDTRGVSTDENLVASIMGRLLTNSNWAVSQKWVYENARTFAGAERGSGVWADSACAKTNGEWICVRANSAEAVAAGLKGISFQPTNELDETYSTLVSSIRIVFPQVCNSLPATNSAAFGVTVAQVDNEKVFMCLVDHVWQKIPRSVAAPELNVEYEFYVYTRLDESETSYLLRLPSGEIVTLLSSTYESGLFTGLHRVNVTGVGDVTDLTALPYSTDLLRIRTKFDEGALYPGTNFEQTTANGDVSLEKLWETDRTNGVLRVVVRDRNGLVVDERYFSFRGVDEDLRFEFYIRNLQPGETYTAEVVTDIPNIDVEGDADGAEGFMARIVTNNTWATSNLWVREDAHTFAGETPGTGVWTTNGVRAAVADECISIDTSGSEDGAAVGFLATNALPTHTGYEYRMKLFFDSPCFGYPDYGGSFGVAVLADESDDTAPMRFALLTNGVWMAADSDIYEPRAGVEYELTLHVDLKERTAYYAVCADGDRRAVTLVEFPLADAYCVDKYKAEFHGVGRVRTHEGDGFDVRLVEVVPTYDERSLVPGTNFTEMAVSGTINVRQLWPTDRTSGSCTVVVRDSHGNLVWNETLTYEQITNQNFNVFLENLEASEAYDVEIVSEVGGESAAADSFVAVMARKYGSWICEDAETFDFLKPGTGDWTVTNESAHVEGGEIAISADLDYSTLSFHPTNDSLAIRSSLIREVRFDLNFSNASWYESSQPPELPPETFAAVAVYSYDKDFSKDYPDTALAVLSSNRTWKILEETRGRFSETNPCEVAILYNFEKGFIRYTYGSGTYTNRIHQFDFDPEGHRDFDFAFAGRGTLRSMDGDVWDAHLIRNSSNEYYDLESAIRATDNENDVLSPLWWARQYVTLPRGSFRVFDTNDWLTVVFPDWYYVVKTQDGEITIYRFNASNNWIDYAEGGESNIVIDVEHSLFFVKTPEGLSWLAALATNEWVSGRIELATNIDLTVHNWTPIAGFSGSFDGCGWRIDGLNNTNRWVGIPGGEYLCGPTNRWGRSTYGLFGTATNAVLANVTFAGVSISNLADSVGTLAGALAGNCTVSNVTVESGSILGVGGTVAGLAGFADFTDFLTFVNNTNAASVTAESDVYGESRTAAGILCIAGPTDPTAPLGTVVVTNNVNAGVIANTLYDADLFGGNVGQILAGTTLGARFGDVHLTNNVAAGSVDAFHVNTEAYCWPELTYPAVNLASAYWGLDEDAIFLHALDANEPGAVAVDPVHRTARMLSDIFANGSTSHVGRVNDALTTLPAGSTYTLPEGLNEWRSIRLDRNMTFDMNGKTVFMIYTNSAFEVSAGVTVWVQNGTVVVGSESAAFGGDLSGLTNVNVKVEKMDGDDFYDRTTFLIDGEFTSLADLDVETLNGAGTVLQLFEETCISIDVDTGVLKLDGVDFMTLSEAYSFKTLKDDDGTVIGYRVTLADTAANMPRMTLSVGSSQVTVGVTNTRKGMTYQLQRKREIELTWTDVGEGVPVTVDNTPIELKDESPEPDKCFYRVYATETAAGE